MKIWSISLLAVLISGYWVFRLPEAGSLQEDLPVADLLLKLGDAPLPHQPDMSIPGVSAARGRELVRYGMTTRPEGGKTKRQSRHFVCTSCHNVEREDPDLRFSDPQGRLEYVRQKGLPFLQGTTLYGAVNRIRFYNGDYEKKYGQLVVPARENIREAIQLCAVECSQGRRLEPWELESILAYLWTIGLKMSDLGLNSMQQDRLYAALRDGKDRQEVMALIKSRYLSGSPATFLDPPPNRREGAAGLSGNAENGRWIYELSCLHCHEGGKYALFKLDHSKTTFQYLKKHLPLYTRYSAYQVVRYGTSPVPGKSSYMPNYTQERLTPQQMEDLRAYIESRAEI